ncbi:MAG: 23S rRNA (guanosine(2251)-2'-O)-methyltransferase RlmB [Desulfofustis sp.]|nr:23S rRNA (guanosine(2251)-2'-O)-methyltransferase RlmB [Desulfofustis sp.]
MTDTRRREQPRSGEQRIKYSEDLLWGVHPVLEAVRQDPGRLTELIVQKDRQGHRWQELIETARAAGIKCSFTERIKITGSPEGTVINHQGVVARGAAVRLLPFDELLALFAEAVADGQRPKLLACDSLQDPHNLGAIIRSAHAAGVRFIVVTRERSAPLGGTAAKAAAGALSRVHLCQVTNLVDALQALKKAGAWVFGAVNDAAAVSIYQTDFDLPACLVVGNEGRGIRPLVRRSCDHLITIPMAGGMESLNSSVAGAVIMFEMYRQAGLVQKGGRAD